MRGLKALSPLSRFSQGILLQPQVLGLRMAPSFLPYSPVGVNVTFSTASFLALPPKEHYSYSPSHILNYLRRAYHRLLFSC